MWICTIIQDALFLLLISQVFVLGLIFYTRLVNEEQRNSWSKTFLCGHMRFDASQCGPWSCVNLFQMFKRRETSAVGLVVLCFCFPLAFRFDFSGRSTRAVNVDPIWFLWLENPDGSGRQNEKWEWKSKNLKPSSVLILLMQVKHVWVLLEKSCSCFAAFSSRVWYDRNLRPAFLCVSGSSPNDLTSEWVRCPRGWKWRKIVQSLIVMCTVYMNKFRKKR